MLVQDNISLECSDFLRFFFRASFWLKKLNLHHTPVILEFILSSGAQTCFRICFFNHVAYFPAAGALIGDNFEKSLKTFWLQLYLESAEPVFKRSRPRPLTIVRFTFTCHDNRRHNVNYTKTSLNLPLFNTQFNPFRKGEKVTLQIQP